MRRLLNPLAFAILLNVAAVTVGCSRRPAASTAAPAAAPTAAPMPFQLPPLPTAESAVRTIPGPPASR